MSLKSFRLMLEYRLKIALLFLQPAAARDRKPLPQSTVLALSTGQATIASPDHPNSFRLHGCRPGPTDASRF